VTGLCLLMASSSTDFVESTFRRRYEFMCYEPLPPLAISANCNRFGDLTISASFKSFIVFKALN